MEDKEDVFDGTSSWMYKKDYTGCFLYKNLLSYKHGLILNREKCHVRITNFTKKGKGFQLK